LKKSQFYKCKLFSSSTPSQGDCLYAQASKSNVNDIIKIKDNFLNLLKKKVNKVYKMLNESKKNKPKFNIMMKSLLRKQVIISMNSTNADRFIVKSNSHIININRALKDIKSDIMADFVQVDHRELVITTNKVAATLNLNTIEKYIKNVDAINTNEVMSLKLPQSKLYLKILGISMTSSLPLNSELSRLLLN